MPIENPETSHEGLKNSLQKAWLDKTFLSCLLWPLSQLYGAIVWTRRRFYHYGFLPSASTGVPTIIIGNVVAGGAGKTPLVIELVRHLRARGLQVGVISRGYGRAESKSQEVFEKTPIFESGDEPALIKRATNAPVFVASRRIEAARALLAAYPHTQVVVCDDGLQHYSLRRDIEVAVFDDRGTGNGWLLPAGPLREPWPWRLSQGIDLVLHTGQNPAFAGFTSSRQLADNAVAADGTQIGLANLVNQNIVALAAIANPDAFFDMLKARGLKLSKTIRLPDHHDFSGFQIPADQGATVLCTEKDAVKLFGQPSASSVKLFAVPLQFSAEPAFFAALDDLLAPLLSKLPSSHGH